MKNPNRPQVIFLGSPEEDPVGYCWKVVLDGQELGRYRYRYEADYAQTEGRRDSWVSDPPPGTEEDQGCPHCRGTGRIPLDDKDAPCYRDLNLPGGESIGCIRTGLHEVHSQDAVCTPCPSCFGFEQHRQECPDMPDLTSPYIALAWDDEGTYWVVPEEPEPEVPRVVRLMEALEQSIATAKATRDAGTIRP